MTFISYLKLRDPFKIIICNYKNLIIIYKMKIIFIFINYIIIYNYSKAICFC